MMIQSAIGGMSPAEARALENAVRVLQSEGQLDEADARALTDATAELAHLLWRMLLRLYQGKAHLALGFKSWGTYFEVEFGGRKTHGYELLALAVSSKNSSRQGSAARVLGVRLAERAVSAGVGAAAAERRRRGSRSVGGGGRAARAEADGGAGAGRRQEAPERPGEKPWFL
jgi:hypothetical protein